MSLVWYRLGGLVVDLKYLIPFTDSIIIPMTINFFQRMTPMILDLLSPHDRVPEVEQAWTILVQLLADQEEIIKRKKLEKRKRQQRHNSVLF